MGHRIRVAICGNRWTPIGKSFYSGSIDQDPDFCLAAPQYGQITLGHTAEILCPLIVKIQMMLLKRKFE